MGRSSRISRTLHGGPQHGGPQHGGPQHGQGQQAGQQWGSSRPQELSQQGAGAPWGQQPGPQQGLGQEQQGPPLSAIDVYPEQAHTTSEEFISVPSMHETI